MLRTSPVLPGDFAERGAGRIESGAAQVRVVQDVEGLGAELHSVLLGDREGLEESQIPVLQARIVDNVANVILLHERALGRLLE